MPKISQNFLSMPVSPKILINLVISGLTNSSGFLTNPLINKYKIKKCKNTCKNIWSEYRKVVTLHSLLGRASEKVAEGTDKVPAKRKMIIFFEKI